MELSTAKWLGIIGTILLFIPYAQIIGWILVLISIYYLSEIAKEKRIFTNFLTSIIMGIAASIIIFVLVIMFIYGYLKLEITSLIPFIIAFYVLLVASFYFCKRSYELISKNFKVKQFSTAGMLYFIGGILTIVIIGGILIFIANIYSIIGFINLPEKK